MNVTALTKENFFKSSITADGIIAGISLENLNPRKLLIKAAAVMAALSVFAGSGFRVYAQEEIKVPVFDGDLSNNNFDNNAGPGVSSNQGNVKGPGIPSDISTGPGTAESNGGRVRPNVNVKQDATYRIYVSKKDLKLTLYENNTAINQWDCSVGANSAQGDKETEGDKRTPEGKFYICTKNEKSVCYLSLGLSYPSIDDAQRGYEQGLITQEQKDEIIEAVNNKRQPNWYTPLGGEIMIHGGYVKGQMTRGCVAVANEVMDILWEYAQLGMEVEIGQ